jgi:hypothetical protein
MDKSALSVICWLSELEKEFPIVTFEEDLYPRLLWCTSPKDHYFCATGVPHSKIS